MSEHNQISSIEIVTENNKCINNSKRPYCYIMFALIANNFIVLQLV